MNKSIALLSLILAFSAIYLFFTEQLVAIPKFTARSSGSSLEDGLLITSDDLSRLNKNISEALADEKIELKPLLAGIKDKTAPESWITGSIDFSALEKKNPVTLPLGKRGTDVVFANYSIKSTPATTSYSGIVKVDGFNQPLTISRGPRAIFVTLPTSKGVYEGRGNQGNITFKKRPPFIDSIDQDHSEEHLARDNRVIEDVCLNC
jgi:hypothetical protein